MVFFQHHSLQNFQEALPLHQHRRQVHPSLWQKKNQIPLSLRQVIQSERRKMLDICKKIIFEVYVNGVFNFK